MTSPTRQRQGGDPRKVSAGLAGGLIQNPLVSALSRLATGHRLRILAFHGVDDATHFGTVLQQVVESYTPVDGDDIVAALNGTRSLPSRSVWVTFDDGLRSTFGVADLLTSHGIRATAFVNPASIETPSPLWFQILEAAERHGLIHDDEADTFGRARLKTSPDVERRGAIADLEARCARAGLPPSNPSGDLADLQRWVTAGHEVGNHTWDHPCLDMCDEREQVRQVELAHEWLVAQDFKPRFFAYPNGNWAQPAELTARRLGYTACVMFDHRLAGLHGNPHRLSRLRISSSAHQRRVASILSGAHSGAFALSSKARHPWAP